MQGVYTDTFSIKLCDIRLNIHVFTNSDRILLRILVTYRILGRIPANIRNVLRMFLEFRTLSRPKSNLIINQSSLTSMTTYRHHRVNCEYFRVNCEYFRHCSHSSHWGWGLRPKNMYSHILHHMGNTYMVFLWYPYMGIIYPTRI